MAKTQVDKYSNVIISQVVESAANTLTFQQLPQITTLLEKKAYLVNRIVYEQASAFFTELKADAESAYYGLALSNAFSAPLLSEASIFDYNRDYCRTQTAVGYDIARSTVIKDYSTLPGGGILIPTRPVYLYVKGANLANPLTLNCRIYFTIVDLSPEDFWDLVESLSAFS